MLMRAGAPVPVCIAAAIAIGMIIGYCNGLLSTTLGLPPFIATLGMTGILRGAVLIITNGTPVSSIPKSVTGFFGRGSFLGLPISFIILLVLMAVFQLVLSKTVFGRNVFALGGNLEATRLAGINVGSRTRMIYMLSGMLAGVAGMLLIGRVNTASPMAATGYELNSIAASVIGGASMLGGVGTVWGAIIGAFIMSILSNGFTHLQLNDFFQQSATGFILILAVYVDTLQRKGFKKK
jgi:ribose transport system permease protein